jgi:hypothetical protein
MVSTIKIFLWANAETVVPTDPQVPLTDTRWSYPYLLTSLAPINVFWNVKSSSPADVRQRFGGTYCFHLQDRRVSQACNSNRQKVTRPMLSACLLLVICLTFNHENEAVSSSETSQSFYQIARHHIPKDSSLYSHSCENLKYKKSYAVTD